MSDIDDDDDDLAHVRWWDDFEITGKTEATREKQRAEYLARLEKLYQYCRTDVEAERLAETKLYPLSPSERQVYLLDQTINDRGISVDLETTRMALELVEKAGGRLNERIAKITNGLVTTINQRDKMIQWFGMQGSHFTSLDKQGIVNALKDTSLPPQVREVLEIRQIGAKSSTKKLQAILNMADSEGRIHGNLLYHGASTGRFSGKGVQLQNLPRPEILKEPEDAIPYIKKGDIDLIEMCFGPVQTVAADVIRSLVMAAEGKVLYAADFAAIEARVLAWLAGQQDLVDQFANGDDIYCNFASIIYGRPINKKDDPRSRQLGKASVLGLGYAMGASKFALTCAKDQIFLEEEEYKRVVKLYRDTYSLIPKFWYALERAAMRAISNPNSVVTLRNMKFRMRDGNLRLLLPSGRALNYPEARVCKVKTPWGEMKNGVQVMAVNSLTRKWEQTTISPGTFTENVVQAVSRDLMISSMFRLEEHNYPVLLTVHDEVVSEVDEGYGSVAEYEALVAATPDWAAGLPVKAEGWSGKRYRK